MYSSLINSSYTTEQNMCCAHLHLTTKVYIVLFGWRCIRRPYLGSNFTCTYHISLILNLVIYILTILIQYTEKHAGKTEEKDLVWARWEIFGSTLEGWLVKALGLCLFAVNTSKITNLKVDLVSIFHYDQLRIIRI